ncbi:MAG: pilus assembly FimT family protein [Planctomycetota bacterium]|jgi:type II secretory pathway pseudopilin PulG
MKRKNRQLGFTLPEQIIVVAGVVLLAAIALPGVKAFFKTFESADAAKTLISSALTSAQSIAVKQQRYAGIRFQKIGYQAQIPTNSEENVQKLMQASQYIIFIVHDPGQTGLSNGFRAVEGIAPIKLPNSIGVMDLKKRLFIQDIPDNEKDSTYIDINTDSGVEQAWEMRDTTSFSIIFSPTGKLIVHDVRIRNRDGIRRPYNILNNIQSLDYTFNSRENIVLNKTGMFVQDDYVYLGLGQEPSRRSFIIYEKDKLLQAYEKGVVYSQYLEELKDSSEIYINPYTGTMINQQKQGN